MNIQEQVNTQLENILAEGKVEEMIKKQLEETVRKTVSGLLEYYSDFGKKLKSSIEKSLDLSLAELNLSTYNKLIVSVIEEELHNTTLTEARTKITESIKKITGLLEKKEWELSEIIELLVKEATDDDEECGEVTMIVEKSSYGTTYLYLDEEEGKNKYDCEFRLNLDKNGKIWHYEHKGQKPTGIGVMSRFESLIFKLYAEEATVILDTEKCDTTWSRYED